MHSGLNKIGASRENEERSNIWSRQDSRTVPRGNMRGRTRQGGKNKIGASSRGAERGAEQHLGSKIQERAKREHERENTTGRQDVRNTVVRESSGGGESRNADSCVLSRRQEFKTICNSVGGEQHLVTAGGIVSADLNSEH